MSAKQHTKKTLPRLGVRTRISFKAAIRPKTAINSEEIPIHLVMMMFDSQAPKVPAQLSTPFTPPSSEKDKSLTKLWSAAPVKKNEINRMLK